jgi:hypothetical protein
VPLGSREHRRRSVESDDLVAILRERYRDAAGTAPELEDRPAGPARDRAEPIGRGGWPVRGVEVVQGGQPLGLLRGDLLAEPIGGGALHGQREVSAKRGPDAPRG